MIDALVQRYAALQVPRYTSYPFPDAMKRYVQARAVAAAFADHGYSAIGIDHFARPDDALVAAREARLHRNFQGYTDDDSAESQRAAARLLAENVSGVRSVIDKLVCRDPSAAITA